MKKTLLILVMALLVALPVFGLAAEVTTAPETQSTAPAVQFGPRWRQTIPAVPAEPADPAAPAVPTAPWTGYVDADGDGVCDNCGQAQGQNPGAPGFTDADGDGVCDHLGTPMQRRFAMGSRQMMRGRAMHMRSFAPGAQMPGRGVQGTARGSNYVDADNDGVCDNLGTAPMQNMRPGQRNFAPAQPGVRPGRNRR